MSQIVLVVIAATLVLGMALLATLRAERRRMTRQQRLQAVVSAPPPVDEPGLLLRRPQSKGRLPGLQLLSTAQRRLDEALAATGGRIGLPHLALTGSVAGIVITIFADRIMLLGPTLAALLGIGTALAAPILLLRLAQNRFQNRFLDSFPDALDLVGRAVKAGLPVVDAMEVAAQEIPAPVGSEFRQALDQMRIGTEIEQALQGTADRIRVTDFRFFAAAIALQRRTGGSLAETLANLSNIIRRRKEIRLKTRALTAEAKASVIVLSVLPWVVGAGLFLINGELMSILFADQRGRFMLGVAVLNLFAGMAVMAWMIKRALR
jgi:Flp pilus assembly protein TadB